MKKGVKAQITLFVIISVLIVTVTILLVLSTLSSSDPNIIKVDPEFKPVYAYVKSCVDKTAKEAVFYIGDTGGYYLVPELATENNIAYYFYNDENLMPSIDFVEKELEKYMDDMLFFCTKNFVDFPEYEVDYQETITDVIINENDVYFDISYPLSISKDGQTFTIDEFETIVPVRLGRIIESLDTYMSEQEKITDAICLSCLESVSEPYNLQIYMWDYDDDVIFSTMDLASEMNEEPYEFFFAFKFSEDDINDYEE